MTNEQAKSELMQLYGSLSEEKKQALDVLMAQADGEYDDVKYHEEHGEVVVDKAVWEDAKRALEQEPKMVEYTGDGYADGKMVYDMANCPNCGREFEDGDKTWNCNFCPDCGQALDWGLDNAEED